VTTSDRLTTFTDWLAADGARYWLLIVPALLAALVGWRVVRFFRAGRPDARVTLVATVIGLGWSAQGMWDTAVHHYKVAPALAAVLFLLFESFMVGNMLRAVRYRTDRIRRARPVRFVWLTAVVMGIVVSLAEGAGQAPLRIAVPLLVAGNWWIELVADDDPADRLATSWKWTPRRLGLALGLLEPGARDAVTIDRDRLTAKLTDMRFRQHYGWAKFGDLTGRVNRIRKLTLLADDAILAESDARLVRAARSVSVPALEQPAPIKEQPAPESHPTMPEQPDKPKRVPTPPAPPSEPVPAEGTPLPQGVHIRAGRTLRGPALRADATDRLHASIGAERPRGMTAADLAALYTPPLGRRTAEAIAADARRTMPTNGHEFTNA
jgi:hypothetical protein